MLLKQCKRGLLLFTSSFYGFICKTKCLSVILRYALNWINRVFKGGGETCHTY
jgi:hypothetical protein